MNIPPVSVKFVAFYKNDFDQAAWEKDWMEYDQSFFERQRKNPPADTKYPSFFPELQTTEEIFVFVPDRTS